MESSVEDQIDRRTIQIGMISIPELLASNVAPAPTEYWRPQEPVIGRRAAPTWWRTMTRRMLSTPGVEDHDARGSTMIGQLSELFPSYLAVSVIPCAGGVSSTLRL